MEPKGISDLLIETELHTIIERFIQVLIVTSSQNTKGHENFISGPNTTIWTKYLSLGFFYFFCHSGDLIFKIRVG